MVIFRECLDNKSGLRILIMPPEVPFFWSQKLLAKVTVFGQKKWHFWWQNQNSKTTFIVQTFPKYCRNGFYFMKLSLLSLILAKFQFCWFSGLFWAFFPCKKCKNKNLSLNFNFWSITLNFFLWTHTTHEHEWLQGCSSIKKKVKNGTPYWWCWCLQIKMLDGRIMVFILHHVQNINPRLPE